MQKPELHSLDHLVLTVADIDATTAFYRDVLGMTHAPFQVADGSTRHAVAFGPHKINLHPAGDAFEPKARVPRAGSADLCFLTQHALEDWLTHLAAHTIDVERGPVARTGAQGPITSIYIRDPDGNLIEISVQRA